MREDRQQELQQSTNQCKLIDRLLAQMCQQSLLTHELFTIATRKPTEKTTCLHATNNHELITRTLNQNCYWRIDIYMYMSTSLGLCWGHPHPSSSLFLFSIMAPSRLCCSPYPSPLLTLPTPYSHLPPRDSPFIALTSEPRKVRSGMCRLQSRSGAANTHVMTWTFVCMDVCRVCACICIWPCVSALHLQNAKLHIGWTMRTKAVYSS